jgi:hypothetical protein
MFHKNETKCEFITVKNDYYLVNSDKENNLHVPLFISLKDSIFVDLEEINNTSLVTDNETEVLPLTINSLTYLDEVNYDDKKFYEYDLNFCLDMVFDSLTIYDQIYLKILYKSGASIKILLGSITLYNYSLNEEVFYTNLKGVTRKHNNNMILSNVLVKFNTQSQIEIVDIKTLNSKVSVDLEYSEVIDYIDYISADLKIPSCTDGNDIFKEHDRFLSVASLKPTYVKVVFDSKITDNEISSACALAAKHRIELILQPKMVNNTLSVDNNFMENILDKFLSKYKKVRLIPQIHKFLDLK